MQQLGDNRSREGPWGERAVPKPCYRKDVRMGNEVRGTNGARRILNIFLKAFSIAGSPPGCHDLAWDTETFCLEAGE